MITKEEVQTFLNQFHSKMKVFGIMHFIPFGRIPVKISI